MDPSSVDLIALINTLFDTATLEGGAANVIGTESTKGSKATNTPMVFILDNGEDGDGNDESDQKKKNQEKISMLFGSFNLCGLQSILGL